MKLPVEREALVAHLIERARAHFPDAADEILERAATMLVDDRERARKHSLSPLPGQAEYLDLLRAVLRMEPDDPDAQAELLEELGEFALKKNA